MIIFLRIVSACMFNLLILISSIQWCVLISTGYRNAHAHTKHKTRTHTHAHIHSHTHTHSGKSGKIQRLLWFRRWGESYRKGKDRTDWLKTPYSQGTALFILFLYKTYVILLNIILFYWKCRKFNSNFFFKSCFKKSANQFLKCAHMAPLCAQASAQHRGEECLTKQQTHTYTLKHNNIQ